MSFATPLAERRTYRPGGLKRVVYMSDEMCWIQTAAGNWKLQRFSTGTFSRRINRITGHYFAVEHRGQWERLAATEREAAIDEAEQFIAKMLREALEQLGGN